MCRHGLASHGRSWDACGFGMRVTEAGLGSRKLMMDGNHGEWLGPARKRIRLTETLGPRPFVGAGVWLSDRAHTKHV